MISNLNIDLFWLNKLSYRLEQFSKARSTSRIVFVCRCPICGDSKSKKFKKRFYIYEKKQNLNTNCKNCGYSRSFYNFVKEIFPEFFDDYKKDILRDKMSNFSSTSYKKTVSRVNDEPEVLPEYKDSVAGCFSISGLPLDHYCVQYLKSRCLDKYHDKFLFSPDFKITANEFSYKGVDEKFPSEPRLVIPFYDSNNKIKALQGRSFDKDSNLKYITIKCHEDADKIYGLERLDRSKTSYCIEGPIDSLFIDNCVATCDSNLTSVDVDVYIWDNQPRSKEIVALMQNCIDTGGSLVIWPDMGNSKVDINDLIIKGVKQEDIMSMIRSRTFHGLRAKMEFVKWKKL